MARYTLVGIRYNKNYSEIEWLEVYDKARNIATYMHQNDLISKIEGGIGNLEGVRLGENCLEGTNGDLRRYNDVRGRYVVLYKTKDSWVLRKSNGSIGEAKESDLQQMKEKNIMICNGYIKQVNGAYILSAFNGTFDYVEKYTLPKPKEAEVQKVERKDEVSNTRFIVGTGMVLSSIGVPYLMNLGKAISLTNRGIMIQDISPASLVIASSLAVGGLLVGGFFKRKKL
ncbi:hypothetical protein D3C81_07190 [compost metagenome]